MDCKEKVKQKKSAGKEENCKICVKRQRSFGKEDFYENEVKRQQNSGKAELCEDSVKRREKSGKAELCKAASERRARAKNHKGRTTCNASECEQLRQAARQEAVKASEYEKLATGSQRQKSSRWRPEPDRQPASVEEAVKW